MANRLGKNAETLLASPLLTPHFVSGLEADRGIHAAASPAWMQ